MDTTMSLKWNSAVILVHFPKNGHHGCNKRCHFCLANKIDYNIEVKPTDDEIISFISNVKDGGKIQICGIGDPLFNFEENSGYLCHIIDIIHYYNHPIELVTKYTEVVQEYLDTKLSSIEIFLFSVETINNDIYNLINKITSLGKYVRISKVANFTSDIHNLDYKFLESYAAFYSNITNKKNLKICFRPNFNFEYNDVDVLIEQAKIASWAYKYSCHIYMHTADKHLATKQLWNGRFIPCGETRKYLLADMNIN